MTFQNVAKNEVPYLGFQSTDLAENLAVAFENIQLTPYEVNFPSKPAPSMLSNICDKIKKKEDYNGFCYF